MREEIKKDLGEEIIMKIKELIAKYKKLLKQQNEEELADSSLSGNRT